MIIRKRPLINMKTALENIPREWLVNVEPHIIRGQYLPCWLWNKGLDSSGWPSERVKIGDKLVRRAMHRFVARIFYDFPDEYYVIHIASCKYKNCLHPAHLVPTPTHPRWA
jgi:hypothetical protein